MDKKTSNLMNSFANLFNLSLFFVNLADSSCEYSIQKEQHFILDMKTMKKQLAQLSPTEIHLEFVNSCALFSIPLHKENAVILAIINMEQWSSKITVSINRDNIEETISLLSLSIIDKKLPISLSQIPIINTGVIEKKLEDNILGQAKLNINEGRLHQNYQKELELFKAVREGNLNNLEEIFNYFVNNSNFYAKLSDNEFRHVKNMLICNICLASRAAIEGGLSKEISFSLSDHYICEVENLPQGLKIERIFEFLGFAFKSFTKQVAHNKKGTTSGYVARCQQIIYLNIYGKLTVDSIAKELGISKNYLTNLFKTELGYTIKEYILQQKIIEAQYLILHSKYSFQDIWSLLNFSSQSHFIKTFKKYLGITPKQYKNIYQLIDI